MNIIFTTNLDEAQPYVRKLSESWPADCIPRVGERIEFAFGESGKTFQLEVCAVVYRSIRPYKAVIELHMPSYYSKMSINEWSEWFKRHERS